MRLEERPAPSGGPGALGTPGRSSPTAAASGPRRDSYGEPALWPIPALRPARHRTQGNLRRAGGYAGGRGTGATSRVAGGGLRPSGPDLLRPPGAGRGAQPQGVTSARASRPLRRSAPGSREAQSQAGPLDPPPGRPRPPPDPARSSPVIFVVVQPLNRVSPCDPMAGSTPRLLCPAIFPQSGPQARPSAPPLPAAPPPAVRQRLRSQSQVRSPRPRLPLTGPAPSLCSNRKPSLAKPRGNHTLQVANLCSLRGRNFWELD